MSEPLRIHIDFETASDLDVTEVGAYRYAEHPSTFVRCMCYAVGDGPVKAWVPGLGAWPDEIMEALKFGHVYAFNANFERQIMRTVIPRMLNVTTPTFSQYRCVAAWARSRGLPGSLAKAAKVLELDVQKGDQRIMKKLAKASHQPTTAELTQLIHYCKTDVEVEREITRVLADHPMTDDEQFVFEVNEHINDRGVRIDVVFAKRAAGILERERLALDGELAEVTGGAVTKVTQVARLKKWIADEHDLHVRSLDKAAMAVLLDGLPPGSLREALEIRKAASGSAGSKYATAIDRVNHDGRVRGSLIFAGAAQTGRFSSIGLQVHNLRRDVPKEIEAVAKLTKADKLRMVYGDDTMTLLARSVRGMFIPAEGKRFVIGDFSGVEARGLPWLAEEEDEVESYRQGVDKYIDDAADVFHVKREDVTDAQRQVGKVVRLACGFCGKGGALMAMAEGYGVSLTRDEADQMAYAWHDANQWVERFALRLWGAAVTALCSPGKWYSADRVRGISYMLDDVKGRRVLRCQLPSGRELWYWNARFRRGEFFATKPSIAAEVSIWHGLLAENVTQAVCNDLLRYSMALAKGERYAVVLHVHDELVAEVSDDDEAAPAKLKVLMQEKPEWAETFPLEAKVGVAERYQK